MLELRNVAKTYGDGDNIVRALKGVSLTFPNRGVTSILGASGCGKTTFLNIIGGLDHPSSGELVIDGASSSSFRSSDWNTYRNESVGFVFQNYYLIPHLNVLENVKIAMSLSGLSAKEQKEKAVAALKRVGLGDQLHKKPRQLSGGQAQRAAIARAIANKPKIILADEPTGALDSENSVQVLELLKELSSETLVVIVTHNAELADVYSDRIIKMKDGAVEEDIVRTPIAEETVASPAENEPVSSSSNKPRDEKPKRRKSPTMTLGAAFKASLKNLYHKKGRTIITALAGCLGVISISVILGLNSGFSVYAENYRRDSLSKYPITVAKSRSSISDVEEMFKYVDGIGGDFSKFDSNAIIGILRDKGTDLDKYTDEEKVYIDKIVTGLGINLDELLKENDTTEFKKYVDSHFDEADATVKFDYNITPNVYSCTENESGVIETYSQISPFCERTGDDLQYLNSILQMIGFNLSTNDINNIKSALSSVSFWDSLVDNQTVLDAQYELLTGSWPQDDAENGEFEVVLVVDKYNRITDASLYALGYTTFAEMLAAFLSNSSGLLNKLTGANLDWLKGKQIPSEYDFNDFIGREFRLLLETDYYSKNAEGLFENNSKNSDYVKSRLASAPVLKISGVVRLREGVDSGCINGDIGYTQNLVNYIIDNTESSPVASRQKAEFEIYKQKISTPEYAEHLSLKEALSSGTKTMETLTEGERALLATQSAVAVKSVVKDVTLSDESSYKTLMLDLGVKDKDSPESILFYPSSLKAVDDIERFIGEYNAEMKAAYDNGTSPVNLTVEYTNDLESIMENLNSVIDTITYILIAVTCLAVVVSLFMVGIIMYISVQDRTKEIGVLRSMGARKIDIMNIFNAETVILGLLSGIIGVSIGYAVTPGVNLLLKNYLGIGALVQPVWWHSLIIIAASVFLTCLSGLFPAIFAAKKDPVAALRTE
ncbi:MAG: ATP-binding cassette domain-containing protein [Christensenellales bacterium]